MTSSFEAPWIEKYRPEFLSDVSDGNISFLILQINNLIYLQVVGNSEAVSRLAAIAQVISFCQLRLL